MTDSELGEKKKNEKSSFSEDKLLDIDAQVEASPKNLCAC
jgi:hypothetical protein